MRIHHLNCMTFHFGVPSITHCLLIEGRDGLILVDTGLGLADYDNPSLIMRAFLRINRVPRNREETAVRQVVRLGYSPEDVHHVVLTHLHLDHSGGLPDFPRAEVHVSTPEYLAAMRPRGIFGRCGYDATHWAHGPRWVLHEFEGDKWFGLPCAQVLGPSLRGIVLVPLFGHSAGHCGVGVETDGGWILHCGDAYARDVMIKPDDPLSPFPKWAGGFERTLFPSQAIVQLRTLKREHGNEIVTFSAHDPTAFARLASTT